MVINLFQRTLLTKIILIFLGHLLTLSYTGNCIFDVLGSVSYVRSLTTVQTIPEYFDFATNLTVIFYFIFVIF